MKKYTLIKNVRLADAERRVTETSDILISRGEDGGYIEAVGNIEKTDKMDIFDGAGCMALPAFIDMHCHLRDPGFTYKEDIQSGTSAAAAGGYSTVVCMPNTNPVIDSVGTLEYIKRRSTETGLCRVLPAAAITKGQKGGELCDFDLLSANGAVAFTDDGRPVSDASVMREAMKRCADKGHLIISHSEEMSLSSGGVINEGRTSRMLGVKGIPDSAESVAVAREVILAEETGCRVHIAHVSTESSVRIIRQAKARGVRVTCETCPHYFSFCDEDVVYYGTNAKMNPPLRSRRDVEAVIEALKDGTIDCISTDHAPHSEKEKHQPLDKAPYGVTGLQTAFSAAVTYLVMQRHIDIYRLIELMSLNPAKILSLEYGIMAGKRADIALVRPSDEMIITKNILKSKSYNTPYLGLTLYGLVTNVFINGGSRYVF